MGNQIWLVRRYSTNQYGPDTIIGCYATEDDALRAASRVPVGTNGGIISEPVEVFDRMMDNRPAKGDS